MNQLNLIGNLTKDPQTRTTQNGVNVCSFTIAVNRRTRNGEEPKTDYFRVSVWRKLADICQQYLAKGRKVFVSGPVSYSTYQAQDGSSRVSMDVSANEVEFLNPKRSPNEAPEEAPSDPSGYTPVASDEIPFR